MDPFNYKGLRLKADRISKEKSVLNYFYSLCDQGMLRFEGKQGKDYFFGYHDQRTGSIAVSDGKNTISFTRSQTGSWAFPPIPFGT